MRRLLTLILLFAPLWLWAQRPLNPSDYIYPVQEVARLYSANFGEMRPGHFHAGIDIKTDGVEG
ncbi:MAG: M23 family peptidase, partial [Alistipes sp.]|nr:M23 family peptidase [Alistipes sp.]